MSFLSPGMMRFPAIWDLWNGFNRDRRVAEITVASLLLTLFLPWLWRCGAVWICTVACSPKFACRCAACLGSYEIILIPWTDE
jgi:hypothetical protein